MIYTSNTLNSKIDSVQTSADNNRKINPTRSTFEDGFAQGLSHVLPTVEKLEQDIRILTSLIEEMLEFSKEKPMNSVYYEFSPVFSNLVGKECDFCHGTRRHPDYPIGNVLCPNCC